MKIAIGITPEHLAEVANSLNRLLAAHEKMVDAESTFKVKVIIHRLE